jgi:hypothetical protein
MSATATVPVTITPEAAARVAELGMQKELDLMLEHTRQVVRGLRAIKVVLEPCYETRDEPGITIWAVSPAAEDSEDRTEWDWGSWLVETFPPQVFEHFVMMTIQDI